MFNGIQARLIISYMVVIVLSLSIALFTLFILARPLQIRTTQQRLSSELNTIIPALQPAMNRNTPTQPGAARILQKIRENLPQIQDRILLANNQGVIVLDAQNQWEGERITLPNSRKRLPLLQPDNVLSGRVTAPDGQSMLIVARPISARIFLALATPYPKTAGAIIRELSLGFIIAGIIAFFVALILGAVIARSVSTPLKQIARASDSVAAGDYSQQVPVSGPAEVQQVAGAFNSMTTQVQLGQQAMKDFVSNVSHDLKTPLTSIQGFSQALLDGTAADGETRLRAARIINDEATRMRRMVDDLLDLARIDAGQVNIEPHPLDVGALLTITLDSLSVQFAESHIALKTEISPLPNILGDADRLKQVFSNLLDNALKFTPEHGIITVASDVTGVPPDASTIIRKRNTLPPTQKFVRIMLADTGSGIPQPELKRIFERFYQVDKSRKQNHGTGLGLAIAFNIIKAHHGYIDAKSIVGQGTTFTVWLPVAP